MVTLIPQLIPTRRDPVGIVWAGLVLATILSFVFGIDEGGSAGRMAAVLVIAFLKIRFIGIYFMDLKCAPLALRGTFEAYCAVVCGVLLLAYFAGS